MDGYLGHKRFFILDDILRYNKPTVTPDVLGLNREDYGRW